MTKNRDTLITAGVTAFNAGHYDEAFMQFQTFWLTARSNESKALAQYANACNQMKLGLVTAPRVMLARALSLTDDEPRQTEVNIMRMRADITHLLALLPPEENEFDSSSLSFGQLEWKQ